MIMIRMMELGTTGVRGRYLREADPGEIAEAAAEVEELGYGAIWIPGGVEPNRQVFDDVARLLASTNTIVVATGIVNMWLHEPPALTAAYWEIEAAYPGRFLLGLGISHRSLLDRVHPGRYDRPLSYLDELDALSHPIPHDRRVIAALGAKMLAVSRDRAAGSHPYIVPVAHTRFARATLGAGPLLAPGLPVVLDPDADSARQLARNFLANPYSSLPNYSGAWLRHDFDERDLADGGSDALVDGLVAWGNADAIVNRIGEHHQAGADHVCVHVIAEDRSRLPREQWRRLAAALA
jgi:probable F420-dependent oxidoreductase